jgi:hypothetical protein
MKSIFACRLVHDHLPESVRQAFGAAFETPSRPTD